MRRALVSAVVVLMLLPGIGRAQTGVEGALYRFGASVARDYRLYYSPPELVRLGIVVGAGGVLANTSLDGNFAGFYQDHVRNGFTDSLARPFNKAGHGTAVALPLIYLGAMVVGGYGSESGSGSAVATWGDRSLRAFILGAPQQVLLTHLLGSYRPTQGNSHWHPFRSHHGVSGHAFYGAIPFLTGAEMARTPWVKYTLYAASVLPAWARINANKHYLSQVFLGWTMAYLATETVARSDARHQREASFIPMVFPGGAGVALHMSF